MRPAVRQAVVIVVIGSSGFAAALAGGQSGGSGACGTTSSTQPTTGTTTTQCTDTTDTFTGVRADIVDGRLVVRQSGRVLDEQVFNLGILREGDGYGVAPAQAAPSGPCRTTSSQLGSRPFFHAFCPDPTGPDGSTFRPHVTVDLPVGGRLTVPLSDVTDADIRMSPFNDSVDVPGGRRVSIDTGSGDDFVRLSAPPSQPRSVFLGAGRDQLLMPQSAGPGGSFDGSLGEDIVSYRERSLPVTMISDGSATGGEVGEGDRLSGFETLIGGGGADRISGGPNADMLTGLGAADVIDGGAGDDRLDGDEGNDVLRGGDGIDRLEGDADDDDLAAGAGNDRLNGGAGNDRVDGGVGDDRLEGGEDSDQLVGGEGNDSLEGQSGNDGLKGEAGDDRLVGEVGDDRLEGGAGIDLLVGGPGNDRLDSGVGDDRLDGGGGNDLLLGEEGNDQLVGDANDDKLFGREGNDRLNGGPGNDNLQGDSGNDVLLGGPGSDVLLGGDGNDNLLARDGEDDGRRALVKCGAGVDTLVADLKDDDTAPLPADCENVSQSDRREGPNVVIGKARLSVSRGGSSRVLLSCPRKLPRACAGTLSAGLQSRRAVTGRATRYRIRPGRRAVLRLKLPASQRARARRPGARVRIRSVERGRHGPKTTIRTVRTRPA